MNHEIVIVCDGCVLVVPTNDIGLVQHTEMIRQAINARMNGKEPYSILFNRLVLHSGDTVTQCVASSDAITGYYVRGATATDLSARQVEAAEKLVKLTEKAVEEGDKWKTEDDEDA